MVVEVVEVVVVVLVVVVVVVDALENEYGLFFYFNQVTKIKEIF